MFFTLTFRILDSMGRPDINQALDFIGLAATEHKQDVFLKRIDLKLVLDDCAEPINSFSQVGSPTSNIDLIKARCITQHDSAP